MTNKKIAFFDIDGTLLDHDKKLPEKTKQAIQKLKEQGVYCAIATGRAPFMYKSLREELGIDSYVSFNGQYVVFEGKEIYKNPLSEEALQKLHVHAEENDHPMVFMNEEEMRASTPDHDSIRQSLGTLLLDHPAADEGFYSGRNIYQSLLFCEGREIEQYEEAYEAFDFIRWHPLSCDVLPKGGSKAEGIKKMIEAAGMTMEDTYAFGDGLNDIEMISEVGTGVAMGNAVPETKAVSDYVTTDVSEDGLSHAIYELGLLK
ncbi:UNVERIFIED_CONTAM: Cof-type HAD-IIB family hydrolase [Halobacillus marinus]|uniref:Cof-type HAD-IIB family hydrolase n=1 Tax=unclassified Halobacillus TaxID=2636472 RepID=UPI0002A50565|nr:MULTISPECIES: Cof-type HAD-IIB family hydrolase [unclassified Halobacillus]ELK44982.1 HAD superfamily hydrolase [Halobacillus sp. BAB-2008]